MPGLAVVTMESDTGLAEDRVVNTYALQRLGEFDAIAAESAAEIIADIYRTIPARGPESFVPARWLSPNLSNANGVNRVDVYDLTGALDGSPHGSPVGSIDWTLPSTGTAATALPSEVALAVTLHGFGFDEAAVETADGADANSAVDRPRQRRTGKVYFGPLNTSAIATVAGTVRPEPAVATNFRRAILTADDRLGLEAVPVRIGVWSRSDALIYSLIAVSTDDALDTQRRRGEGPTLRVREEK